MLGVVVDWSGSFIFSSCTLRLLGDDKVLEFRVTCKNCHKIKRKKDVNQTLQILTEFPKGLQVYYSQMRSGCTFQLTQAGHDQILFIFAGVETTPLRKSRAHVRFLISCSSWLKTEGNGVFSPNRKIMKAWIRICRITCSELEVALMCIRTLWCRFIRDKL